MDRPERPSASRIPSAGLRTPGTRISSAARTPLSSLGKRPAGEAGLGDDAAAARRALNAAQVKQTTLERQIVELERQQRKRDEEIEGQRRQIDQLKQERHILLEGETKEKNHLKACEDEWQTEKTELVKRVNHYRQTAQTQRSQLEDLQFQCSNLSAENLRLKRETRSEIDLLEGRIKEVEGERDGLKGWQRRAESLSIQLEELRRMNADGAHARSEVDAEQRNVRVVRDELQRQSQNLTALQNKKDELQAEVSELRKWKKGVDEREHAAKQIERGLRDEIRSLNVELERARHEVESLTQTFSSSESPAEDAQTLQSRLSALSTLHNEVKSQLLEQTKQNDKLHERLTTLAMDSESAIYDLTRKLEDTNRELRWAKEGRQSAETRERLLKVELEAALAGAGSSDSGNRDSAARVQHLESLVETYKAELEGMSRDSREAEDRLAKGAGMVQASDLAEAEEVIKGLEDDISHLQNTITQLTAANTTLDAEVSELMRRVASGEFNPERERCLELRGNPAAKIHAVRTERLESLKAENAALLDRLAEVDKESASAESEGHGLVPRITYDRLVKENADMEAAHEKRLRRLKEIFGAKSKEFLEAVHSLLGWRIKFDENGADIRLTSMYAPKGRMGLTLKFTSNEGHFGTMAMMGGMARSLEEARDFWVTERQSIPGFLAQVTTEMFEKTTLGRAAGYVGLE